MILLKLVEDKTIRLEFCYRRVSHEHRWWPIWGDFRIKEQLQVEVVRTITIFKRHRFICKIVVPYWYGEQVFRELPRQ